MRKTLPLVVSFLILSASAALAGWDEGVAAFSSGKYEQAIAEFQEIIRQNPEAHSAHYMAGNALQQLNRKEEALQHLRKAYDLNPNELSYKLALGQAYYNVRRYDQVGQLLGAVDPSGLPEKHQISFYRMRGGSRAETGDESGALGDFNKLAKLQPQDAGVQNNYGKMLLSAGRLDEAAAAFRKASQLDPKDLETKRAYVNTLKRKGQETKDKNAKKDAYMKAVLAARELTAANKSFENLKLQLEVELGAKLYTNAVETGNAALAKNKNDWMTYLYTGQAYSSAGKYTEAEAPLMAAKKLTSRPADLKAVWTQLGFIYEKQRKYSQSIEAYQYAGDNTAVARVTENEKRESFNKQVEEENKIIQEMEAEAKKLEEELKELEGGGGGV
jgi:superkiller protein 3